MRIIGLDCGRTELRGIVSDQNGRIWNMARIAAGAEKGAIQYIQNIQSLVNTLAQHQDCIACVGVVSSGRIDAHSGLVMQTTIPGYAGTDLRAVVRAVLATDVYVENSARAALIGEHWIGAAQDVQNAVLLWLGSDVSGATMIDGRIHRGSASGAGEWGHMQIERDGRECGCGRRGCLDRYLGAGVLSEKMEQALGRSASQEEYQALFESGNSQIAAVFDEFVECLAAAVGNIERIENPEVVLIGGAFSSWFDLFMPLLEQELRRRQITTPVRKVQLGADAGCLGAVCLGVEALKAAPLPFAVQGRA